MSMTSTKSEAVSTQTAAAEACTQRRERCRLLSSSSQRFEALEDARARQLGDLLAIVAAHEVGPDVEAP